MSVVDEAVPLTAALGRCAPARRVRVGLLGYGRVGQAVATLVESEGARLVAAGFVLRVAAAIVQDSAKPRNGPAVALFCDAREFFAQRFDIVVDVMGGVLPAFEHVRRVLEAGVPVVTANKTLMAAKGEHLRAIARAHRTTLACDAAVLAGVPFLGALARRPFISAPHRISGIINGTSHFLVCALARGASFAEALDEAVVRGYAEPDSRADISGRDAAEKLTILLHLAGCREVTTADLTTVGIDALTAADFAGALELGGVIKPVVIASLDPRTAGAWVGPALVDRAHPFSSSNGVANFVELAGATGMPVTFSGSGAGPDVTAATILDDVVETLTTGAARGAPACTGPRAAGGDALRQPPASAWYLRLGGAEDISTDDAAELLAVYRLPARRLVRRGDTLFARTTTASWATVRSVVETLTAIGAYVLALPVLDGGRHE